MKTFKQFNEGVKENMPSTTKALQGMKDNKTINAIQNQLKSGEISIPGIKKAVGDGKDLKAVTDLVNKYAPIVKQKKEQYKDLFKKQGEAFKNEAEKTVVPVMKDFANSFKDAFGKSVNSNSFNKK